MLNVKIYIEQNISYILCSTFKIIIILSDINSRLQLEKIFQGLVSQQMFQIDKNYEMFFNFKKKKFYVALKTVNTNFLEHEKSCKFFDIA